MLGYAPKRGAATARGAGTTSAPWRRSGSCQPVARPGVSCFFQKPYVAQVTSQPLRGGVATSSSSVATGEAVHGADAGVVFIPMP